MKLIVVGALAVALGFGGGWLARQQTSSHCYVLPGYTETSSSLLRPSVTAPELVCR